MSNFGLTFYWIDEMNQIKYEYQRIRDLRQSKNITQKELANFLQIKQQQYARYEKGINELPLRHLKNICIYLNTSADYILDLPRTLENPKI